MTTAGREPGSGLVVLDKPAGWTSHQVVGRVRRLAGTRRVGHAGTLDPMATGVLLVGVERATRLLGQLSLTTKSYTATVRLGVATVTDDAEGEVVSRAPAEVEDADLEAALQGLRGEIAQVPSAVSAVKVDGVRSYARVRAGQQVELAARRVTVRRFEVLQRRQEREAGLPVLDLDVAVDCSSGTYVRALARDLGGALGVGGHLTALRRTRVGDFDIAEAQTLDDAARDGLALLGLTEVARRCFPTVTVDERQAAAVRHGRPLPELQPVADRMAVLAPDGEFLALYRPADQGVRPESVFASPQAGGPADRVHPR